MMTRKEAAKILRSEICEPYTGEYSSELTCVATRMGIDALEQESVLDKIRAEIVEMRSKQNCSCSDCLDIIDKYKTSE